MSSSRPLRCVCASACTHLQIVAAFLCIIFHINACTICFHCVCVFFRTAKMTDTVTFSQTPTRNFHPLDADRCSSSHLCKHTLGRTRVFIILTPTESVWPAGVLVHFTSPLCPSRSSSSHSSLFSTSFPCSLFFVIPYLHIFSLTSLDLPQMATIISALSEYVYE